MHRLPLKEGRPYVAGKGAGAASAFVKVSQAGTLTILVTGPEGTRPARTRPTRPWSATSTAMARSTIADLSAVRRSRTEPRPASPNYNSAADFNLDGIVNQIDAKALDGEHARPHAGGAPCSLS